MTTATPMTTAPITSASIRALNRPQMSLLARFLAALDRVCASSADGARGF